LFYEIKKARCMEDIARIVLAFVIGYVMFVVTFYYLAKLMFPKVEIDEEYEKLVQMYRKSRTRVANNNSSISKRFDPSAFKISNALRHRVNYNKV
jgi:hypothetical protein